MNTPLTTLADWLRQLESRHPSAIELGLERVGMVADRLQARRFNAPVITVAGTNGKGSTVATLVAIARAAGWRVVSYTSPHLLRFNERICCNGVMIDDDQLVQALDAVEAVRDDISLTYFEHTTLAALWWFQRQQPDLVVLEVGLGGRLDAVNLVDTDIAVITSIGMDHQDWLGNTLPQIAREKAGIMRPQSPVIFGERDPQQIMLTLADALAAPESIKGRDYDFSVAPDGLWRWQASAGLTWSDLPKPAVAHDNAATALAALQVLTRISSLQLDLEQVRIGLADIRVMGRAQRIAEAPEIWLDVGHNPHGVAFFWQHLPAARPGQSTHVVFAMLADKDIAGVIAVSAPYVTHWWPAGLEGTRASRGQDIAELIAAQGLHTEAIHSDVLSAYEGARQCASANDRIVVMGSFLTVAAVLAAG